MDHRAECEIGRMFLRGQISEAGFWAANRWQSIIAQFHRVLATPLPTGSALSRMVAPGMVTEEESSKVERPESDEEREDRVLDEHKAAMLAIGRLANSPEVHRALELVVLRDHACRADQLPRLREGLAALCRLWSIDDPDPQAERAVRVRGARAERQEWPYEEKSARITYSDG